MNIYNDRSDSYIKLSILLLNVQKWSEKDMKHFTLTIASSSLV